MELVYLWVEDYKNIQKQGFDFSPRFHCEYDEEKNELTIDENDDYIENFFGDNINVTAIVGKNGSGKSSLLEYLSDSPKFIVTFEKNKFSISQNIKIINKTKYTYITSQIKLDFQHIVSADYIVNNFKELLELYNTDTIHTAKLPKNNLQYIFEYLGIDGYILHSHEDSMIRQLNTLLNSKNFLKTMLTPINIVFKNDVSYRKSIFFNDMAFHLKIENISLMDSIYLSSYDYILIFNDFDDLNNTKFKKIASLYIDKNKNHFSPKNLFNKFEKELVHTIFLKNYKEVKRYCQLFDKYNNIYEQKVAIDHFPDLYEIQHDIFLIPINKIEKEIIKYGELNSPRLNTTEWDIKFSSGEIGVINLLTSLFYALNDVDVLQYIYIDEGESFLHPNWQKKYLSYIIQFIKDNFPNRKIHVILTTHSPFLLSDIPKQNIIFLDKDEKGNCIVVDGLNEKKQTFGANIHTLLSDSFFMEDGLMGEFAKSKIDEVIHYLNGKNTKIKNDDEAQKLVNIIGEPIVKNQLQRMLDSKRLKKVDEIDAIKKSMEEMQKRLNELEK